MGLIDINLNLQSTKMKKIILSLLVLSGSIESWAQSKPFTIEGQLKNLSLSGQYVYLYYEKDGKKMLDSTMVTDGKYVFRGELSHTGSGALFSMSPTRMEARNPKNLAGIFLEQATIAVTHTDSFSNVSVSGSMANTEYRKLMDGIKPISLKIQDLAMAYQKASSVGDTAEASAAVKEIEALRREMKEDVVLGYVKKSPGSPIALFALQSVAGPDIDADVYGPLFDGLSEANKKSVEGMEFKKLLDAAAVTSVGKMAPDFTQNDTLDKPVKLSSFRGHYVLLDFWASWCGPCRMENPNVVATYNQFKGKGFEILGVSLDQPGAKEKWLAAIRKDGLSWAQVSDLKFWDNAVAKAYNVKAIPQNFLIDPQGKIVGKGLRGEELRKRLEQIYKK